MTDDDLIRLNRFLAQAGVSSRRGADELIAAGRVRVGGAVVREPGTRVEPGAQVLVDDRPVGRRPEVYLMLNKPSGFVTTLADPQGRRTVRDLVPGTERVFPVGRLDTATTGLLLLVNDGDLAQRLAHPSHGVDKTYRATVDGRLTKAQAARLRSGVALDDGPTWPAEIRVLEASERRSVLDVVIHEGRNRQVRRMLEAIGHRCTELDRVRYGPLELGGLGRGRVRPLSTQELAALRAAAGAPPRVLRPG